VTGARIMRESIAYLEISQGWAIDDMMAQFAPMLTNDSGRQIAPEIT